MLLHAYLVCKFQRTIYKTRFPFKRRDLTSESEAPWSCFHHEIQLATYPSKLLTGASLISSSSMWVKIKVIVMQGKPVREYANKRNVTCSLCIYLSKLRKDTTFLKATELLLENLSYTSSIRLTYLCHDPSQLDYSPNIAIKESS